MILSKTEVVEASTEIEVSTTFSLLEGAMGTTVDGFPNGVIDACTYLTIIGTRWLVSACITFITNSSIFVVDVSWENGGCNDNEPQCFCT